MSCTRTTDNKYNCPPRMDDGRHYTDYRPRCVVNYETLPKPMSSFDYRMYLMNNAEKLIEQNRTSAYRHNMCESCSYPSTELPEQTMQVCDDRKCFFYTNEKNGLGLGRVHGGEKPSYFPAKHIKPCSAKVKDMNFYPITGKVGNSFAELTGPQGFRH